MDKKLPDQGRRSFLIGSGALAVTAATASLLPRYVRADRTLKIGVYGGYFQDSFDEQIFPDFTAATGIQVESVGTPTSEAWLTQIVNSARAGQVPADISMMANVQRMRGENANVWAALDESRLPATENLEPHFIHRYDDGGISAIGAVSWYLTIARNTEVYPDAPESWGDLWDPQHENRLGLLNLATNSFLLDVTAKTHFGGQDILDSEEGILEVLAKLGELRDNVRLWYRDEGQFQQALESGEIPMGQYYHDVTMFAANQGQPVASTFPREGGILDYGSWAVSRASDRLDEAHEFINYMSQPEVQAKLARTVGTAPTVSRDRLDLSDEEFAAVANEREPIIPSYRMLLERGDWLSDRWTEMVTA